MSFKFLYLLLFFVLFETKTYSLSTWPVLKANTLREELHVLRNIIAELITEFKTHAVALDKINEVLSAHEVLLIKLNQVDETNSTLSKEDKLEIQSNNQLKERSRRQTGSAVAFFARVKNKIANLGDNEIIPFETVVTDTHSAFHGATGVFTCPESGYYYFVTSLMAHPGIHVEAEIVLNGNWFVSVYVKGSQTDNAFDQGTSGGVTYLQANDKVWVRVYQNAHHGSGDMLFSQYSSFSGFKI